MDKGSVLAIVTCEKRIITLVLKKSECFKHKNGQFNDKETKKLYYFATLQSECTNKYNINYKSTVYSQRNLTGLK